MQRIERKQSKILNILMRKHIVRKKIKLDKFKKTSKHLLNNMHTDIDMSILIIIKKTIKVHKLYLNFFSFLSILSI
jgi:hypothetical protein